MVVAFVVSCWTVYSELFSMLQIGDCPLIIVSGFMKTLSAGRRRARALVEVEQR